MAPYRLGVYWQEEEVDLLLEIMLGMGAGKVVMPSGRLQNAQLFPRAARRLTVAGFPRSWEQCRAKFKRLKASFFEALEKWDGIPPKKRRPPFFQPLFRLWEQAKRPSWLDRRAAVFRWRQQQRERAMKEAESEHKVSSTASQQDNTQVEATLKREDSHPSNPDSSSTVNVEILKVEDETPQMDMALPTESVGPPPLQGDGSIDEVIIVKEEDETPQMEMALPKESANPLPQGMFVRIPCTAAVVSSSAKVEQSNRATQKIPPEDMCCKVEKLELSLHQATAQLTQLEREIAQRENNHRTRIDRLEEDSGKMYREIRSLRRCLQNLSHPSKERGQR